MDSYRTKSVYRAINCNISHDKEKPDLTPSTHVFIAFNSESLAFTSISFRDLPRLYDIIGGSLYICPRRGWFSSIICQVS